MKESLDKFFDLFDVDKSGSLSKSELQLLVVSISTDNELFTHEMGCSVVSMGTEKAGALPSKEEVDIWIKEFDTDNDGDISRKEFFTGMQVPTTGIFSLSFCDRCPLQSGILIHPGPAACYLPAHSIGRCSLWAAATQAWVERIEGEVTARELKLAGTGAEWDGGSAVALASSELSQLIQGTRGNIPGVGTKKKSTLPELGGWSASFPVLSEGTPAAFR
eukprot:1194466-Prorocentrum_minimum.AAC.6